MAGFVAKKLLGLILFFTNLIRRLLCFLGRRRRNSGMILPMTTPNNLDSSHNHTQSVPSSAPEPFVMESWDNWGDEARPGQTAPGQGRHQNHQNQYQEQEEEEPDYFSDMTPRFKKPTRIIIKKKEEEEYRSNKFNLNADITYKDPSLGTWDDGENAWEGDLDDDLVSQAEHVIREKRRQERERRSAEHQKKKIDKEVQRSLPRDSRLGVRLS